MGELPRSTDFGVVLNYSFSQVKSVNPDTWTLERWMRETKYKGQRTQLLKNVEDNKSKLRGNKEMISKL